MGNRGPGVMALSNKRGRGGKIRGMAAGPSELTGPCLPRFPPYSDDAVLVFSSAVDAVVSGQ